MIDRHFEEVPDSAFFVTPEIEKKLEPYQRQNTLDTGVEAVPKHSHYFKDVTKLLRIDVYRVLQLFEISDPCIQHAVKKLLVAGGRGAKDKPKDIQETIDTLKRWQNMQEENLK